MYIRGTSWPFGDCWLGSLSPKRTESRLPEFVSRGLGRARKATRLLLYQKRLILRRRANLIFMYRSIPYPLEWYTSAQGIDQMVVGDIVLLDFSRCFCPLKLLIYAAGQTEQIARTQEWSMYHTGLFASYCQIV